MHTHWGVDNLFGLTSILPALLPVGVEAHNDSHKVSCLLMPPPGGPHLFTNPPSSTKNDCFCLNLANEMGVLGKAMKPAVDASHLVPIEITRGAKLASMPKILPLFYKVCLVALLSPLFCSC